MYKYMDVDPHINSFAQNCSNSSALAMESCAKPSIYAPSPPPPQPWKKRYSWLFMVNHLWFYMSINYYYDKTYTVLCMDFFSHVVFNWVLSIEFTESLLSLHWYLYAYDLEIPFLIQWYFMSHKHVEIHIRSLSCLLIWVFSMLKVHVVYHNNEPRFSLWY